MLARKEAILQGKSAADLSSKEGYFVEGTLSALTVSNAATDIPLGVILQGEAATGMQSVAISGGNAGPVHVKLHTTPGTVAAGTFLVLHTDGTVKADPATGARVVVARALEAGAAGELIEAILLNPVAYAA